MKGLASVFILSILCSVAAAASPTQTNGGTQPPPAAAQPAPSSTAAAGSSGSSSSPSSSSTSSSSTPSGQSLFEQTLPLDINTASYYELLAWVQRLGLSQKGNRSELQKRLRDYYKISSGGPGAPPPSANQRIITVKSARSAEYFTVQKIGQKYIRLSGGVDLEMQDPKNGTTHTIRADTIVFNETEKSITASGNVEYVLSGKQKNEVFRGKSLTFNVDNWSGIFFQGVSQSQKEINKNKLTFSYTGRTIHRLSTDIVTLKDGTITSSEAIPPNYKVTASRIWVLAPGEWALANAVLYLGHVPLLYFPFFFHPGDNLFFHPSAGYRQEEGYYLQTTTYLLGRRAKANSSLSFLQIAEDTNVTYNTKIRGLFLRKTTPVTASEQSKTPYNSQDSYVRVLFDIYSRLGVFAGIQSKIVDLGILKKLQADLTVARSRNIFLIGGVYTPQLPQSDGTFTSLWNSSSLFGRSLPLRYGANLSFDVKSPVFTATAAIPFYSDPYYHADFSNRSESMDWSRILGLTGSSPATTTPGTATVTTSTTPQPLSSLLWSFHSTVTPNTSTLAPFVTQASITAADMSMYWPTTTRSTAGVEGLDPNLPNYVPPGEWSDFAFPGRLFFYPQSYILPSVAAKLTGTLFQTPSAGATAAAAAQQASTPGASGAGGSGSAPQGGASGTSSSPSSASPTAKSGTASEGTSAPPATTATGAAGAAARPGGTETAGSTTIPPRPPWETAPQQPEQGTSPVRVPKLQPSIPIQTPSSLFPYTQSLTYSITPTASVENRTVSSSWQSPADINLGEAYSIFSTHGSGAFTYSGALFSNLLTVQDVVGLTGNYKIHYNRVPSVSDWQSFLLQDYNATFARATNSLTLTTFPLQGIEQLRGSNLSYSLSTDLFTRTWVPGSTGPDYTDSFLQWNASHVSTHSLAATLDFAPNNEMQSLALSFVLPPLVPEIDLKAVNHVGPLTTTVTDTATRPRGSTAWQFQPLTFDAALAPFAWFNLDQQLIYDFSIGGWTTSTSTISFFNSSKSFNASETLTYDLHNNYPTDSLTKLDLWFFNFSFEAKRMNLFQFSFPGGWSQTSQVEFVPANLSAGINYDYKSPPLWKNRIHFETGIDTAWNLNLQQFTDNSLTLNLTAKLSIYKFLDVSFSLQSEDRATYRYFPQFASQVGQSPINPLTDFLKSVNFFKRSDRTESNFKMKSVDLKLVHHLGDWNLNLEFTGTPELTTPTQGPSYYQWNPTVTLSVDWKPVPEIKSNISVQNDQISF